MNDTTPPQKKSLKEKVKDFGISLLLLCLAIAAIATLAYAALDIFNAHKYEIKERKYEQVAAIATAHPELKGRIQEALNTDCRDTPAPCISISEFDEIADLADQLTREKAIKSIQEVSEH